MAKVWSPTRAEGFSPVEILLAATIFGFLVVAVIGALVYGRSSTASAGDRARALQLADEGVQAVNNIRDAAYNNLVDGTYGLTSQSNQWAFLGSSDTSGIYTRQTTIASSGANRKTVTCTVTWPQAGGTTGQASIVSQFMNWAAAPAKSWANAILAGRIDTTSGSSNQTATAGNYVYTTTNAASNNFIVTNISNPAAPTIVSTVSLPGKPTNIAVSGNYAYVTNTARNAQLQTVDITNPATPSLVKSTGIAGNASATSIVISNGYAFVTRLANGGNQEFAIFSLANPASPTLVGSYSLNTNMRAVYVSGSYAYIVTDSHQLIVLNISVPLLPSLVATLTLSGTAGATSIVGYGSYVFIGQGSTLWSVNVSTPSNPTVTSSYNAGGTVNNVAMDTTGTYAFLGTSHATQEFQVVNITNPSLMALIKAVDVSSITSAVLSAAYNTSLDLVAGGDDSQEVVIFTKN